jgi:CBS domain containing-hemolysin-like protein
MSFTGHLFGNREELRLVMQESGQAFSSEERAMINRVLDLQSLTVRQAVTQLLSQQLSRRNSCQSGMALCRERKVSRLPIWETRDGRQRIIGLLNLNTLCSSPDWMSIVRFPTACNPLSTLKRISGSK